MKLTRRELGKMTLAAAAFPWPENDLKAPKPNSKVAGVQIGTQSYSFRDRSLDEAIAGMLAVGISSCELWQGHIEPRTNNREEIRKWRLTAPLDTFKQVRKKFKQAGIQLYAYNLSFRRDFTDEEIDRGFQMAKALGVKAITASSHVSIAKKIDQYARRYKIPVGMHNHSRIAADEYARPEDFAEAMNGASRYIAVNLDIGHFTAANYDPIAYIEQHHDRIVTLHIKDRKKNQGDNMPFGQGDTKIVEVLQLLRDRKYKIPANIEFEYRGETIPEMKKCLDYCRKALAS